MKISKKRSNPSPSIPWLDSTPPPPPIPPPYLFLQLTLLNAFSSLSTGRGPAWRREALRGKKYKEDLPEEMKVMVKGMSPIAPPSQPPPPPSTCVPSVSIKVVSHSTSTTTEDTSPPPPP
eukprot:Sspe_Gene.64122::Locus_37517_Transcript_1_1_Confidence_1.000_Length_529::g.64122::m.64122